MYEELISHLRECAKLDPSENTFSEAADAIEELSKMETTTPRWISVEERLPEDGEEVLCYYEYFRYGRFNCMYKTVDRGYFLNGHFGGEPTNGQKAKVLYWMPLPEPPKEEK